MDDLISRQALDECNELMTDINGETVYAVRMSDIRHLPTVAIPSAWIPVSERLPKPYDEEVLVTTTCGNIDTATLIYEPYRTDAEEKRLYNWRFSRCDMWFDYVTAWMPIKPYKGVME